VRFFLDREMRRRGVTGFPIWATLIFRSQNRYAAKGFIGHDVARGLNSWNRCAARDALRVVRTALPKAN
jgi:hypothetical protein